MEKIQVFWRVLTEKMCFFSIFYQKWPAATFEQNIFLCFFKKRNSAGVLSSVKNLRSYRSKLPLFWIAASWIFYTKTLCLVWMMNRSLILMSKRVRYFWWDKVKAFELEGLKKCSFAPWSKSHALVLLVATRFCEDFSGMCAWIWCLEKRISICIVGVLLFRKVSVPACAAVYLSPMMHPSQ